MHSRSSLAACLIAAVLMLAAAAESQGALPDLQAAPVENPHIQQAQLDGVDKLLLRFDSFIANAPGAGLFHLEGDQRAGSAMQHVFEVEHRPDGQINHDLPGATLVYETNDGHNHWHFHDAAAYSLLGAGGSVAAAQKVAFCMTDSEPIPGVTNPPPSQFGAANGNCADGRPDAANAHMGITPGWRDKYWFGLWFQWIDISDVQPGAYVLRAEVDPQGLVPEADEQNAPADVAYTVPGYVAQPVMRSVRPRTPTAIPLDLRRLDPLGEFGNAPRQLQAPKVTIERQAAHGTVSVDGAQAVYTPNADSGATDSFEYSVRENGSQFPRSPARATVTLGEQVTISGAPARLRVRRSAQLSVAVVNGSPNGVTWRVSGVRGGNRRVGRITRRGLYTAPARVPARRRVTIRATTPAGNFGEASIRIVRAAGTRPVPGALGRKRRHGPFKRLGVRRSGRFAVASVVPRRSGRVNVALRTRTDPIGACPARVLAGRTFTCRLNIGGARGRIQVAASFIRKGRVTTVHAKEAVRRPHRQPRRHDR